jgi:lipopolysaccharide transport system permease protein
MAPIVSSLLMMIYFVTPIMWLPKTLGNGELAHILLGFNPVYHLLQIVRQPILGNVPTAENWLISIAMVIIGWIGVSLSVRKLTGRIAFWL